MKTEYRNINSELADYLFNNYNGKLVNPSVKKALSKLPEVRKTIFVVESNKYANYDLIDVVLYDGRCIGIYVEQEGGESNE